MPLSPPWALPWRFANPASAEAKPNSKPPRPTPTATPTPTPTPKPTPKPSPTPTPTPSPSPTPAPTPTPTPSPTPPPPPSYLDGIDVGHHQGAIDRARVAGAGKEFAFVRATAGTLTSDVAYVRNRADARAAGVAVGSYHFGNPDAAANDALNEARWFVQNATVGSGDLVPVLDLEASNGLSATALTTWARTWLTEVELQPGCVRSSTRPNFWTGSMAGTDWFAANGYHVWVAHWTTAASQPSRPVTGAATAGRSGTFIHRKCSRC